jgi:hypothetical protein
MWSKKSDLLNVLLFFFAANVLHFIFLLAVEYYFSSQGREFRFDVYSLSIGFAGGLCLNSLVAAALIFVQLVALNAEARRWVGGAKLLSVFLPMAPVLDFILHVSGVAVYSGYRNLFSAEVDFGQRLLAAMLPYFAVDAVVIPFGYRTVFVLLSVVNAAWIFRWTRSFARSLPAAIFSYVTICLIVSGLSPSDVHPLLVLQNLLVLPLVAWVANIYLIRRTQVTPKLG